jgi:RAQPRD family integrative conjugative element protein
MKEMKSIKKINRVILTAGLLAAILLPVSSFATVAKENIELSRINSVLNSIYPMIAAAKAEAVPQERLKFHYKWLQSDIQAIQTGIAQKINAAQISPRIVNQINTNFINKSNKKAGSI